MQPFKIGASRVDETRYSARIEEKDLNQLIAKAVADAVGVKIGGDGVSVSTCYISSEDSSTGLRKYAQVVITVDHSKQPKAG